MILQNTKTNNKIKIKGNIVQVLYPNPPSSHLMGDFAIVKLRVLQVLEGDAVPKSVITIKGNMPRLEYSGSKDLNFKDPSIYVVNATEVIDKVWGQQYQVDSMRMDFSFSNSDEQKKFLSKILTENQIEKLFSITDNPISLLEQKDVATLTTISGISDKTANRLIEKYDSSVDNARAYVALSDFGLTKNAIAKLVKIYHSPDIAVDRINENPYLLIREVRGYGWKKADEIARHQGIQSNDKIRVKAYTEYYLRQQCEENGHSWLNPDVLLTAVQTECSPISDQDLVNIVHEMVEENVEVHVFEVGVEDSDEDSIKGNKVITERGPILYFEKETNRIGLRHYYNIETSIAENLHRIQTAESTIHFNKDRCAQIIKQVEEEQGFEYTEEQINAIWNIINNQVSILTGKAGCGKSFTVNAIVKILQEYGKMPQMCALSGRASSKLTEITNVQGSTIHKMLAYDPTKGNFHYNEDNKMSGDMFILDEASMVGGGLFASLLKAIPSGAKFLMVGDIAQLESIGMGNVLKDCMSSGVISSNVLTKIHRQARQSGIITESLRVSQGQSAFKSDDILDGDYRGELRDLKFVTYSDYNLSQKKVLDEFKDLYYNKHIPAQDIQVIVPMRVRGNISCRCLNEEIQKIVNNNPMANSQEVVYSDNGFKWTVTYREKDRIIITKNNYKAMTPKGKEVAIFNGNIGYIKEIRPDSMLIELLTQGEVILHKDQYQDMMHSFCVTCHKLQGSSAPYVIFAVDVSAYALLSRELIYTGMTRASKHCSVVAQNSAFFSAVKISRVKLKQTWLKDKLQKLFLTSSFDDDNIIIE